MISWNAGSGQTMLEFLSQLARIFSRRGDLVVAAIVIIAIIMMIVPLPTTLVDIIIALNIATALLILLVAFYIQSPIQFSSLPSIILLATLFRLAITITTTRLILLQADAGKLVQAFGDFVVGGNVAVGLVIFFIITIAQFVVITKGSERVAEVAARFSLDAMPGKQISIDNELRNGDISNEEARVLRRNLERESHLYGSLDGAMKFVKGDAIAGIIIIIVNLLGGLAIGMAQLGMSFSQASSTYSLLTVGDGLVSQIPALLVSIASGTVVTRVASEARRDLGTDIIRQLINDERVLYLAGATMTGLAFIPGFPIYVFITFALALGFGGYVIQRRSVAPAENEAESKTAIATRKDQPPQQEQTSQPKDQGDSTERRVVVRLGAELATAVPQETFEQHRQQLHDEILEDLGVTIPWIALRVDEESAADRFYVDLESVPVAEGTISAGELLILDDITNLELANIPYQIRSEHLFGQSETVWVSATHSSNLADVGLALLTPAEVLQKCLDHMLRRYATQFIGIQETKALLARIEGDYVDLVQEAVNVAPIQKIAEILRRLVEENVPIRNMRLILEAIVEWGEREKDTILLGEYVRMALGRQICFRVADKNRTIAAYVLERAVEERLHSAVNKTAVGSFLNISEEASRPIIDQIKDHISQGNPNVRPVILCAMHVRRHLRNLLMRNNIDVPILSYQELAPEFNVQPLATVDSGKLRAAAL